MKKYRQKPLSIVGDLVAARGMAAGRALPFGLLAIWLLCHTAAARGADWPQWCGSASRNPVSAETGLPETFAPGTYVKGQGYDLRSVRNVRWTAPLGTWTYGTPVVSGGRVYVGTMPNAIQDDPRVPRMETGGHIKGGMLICFDETSGKRLWHLPMPPRKVKAFKSAYLHPNLGLCSSPTVEGDRAYVVSSRGEVLCLDVHGMSNGNQGPFVDEERYWVKEGDPPVPPGPEDADILWRFDMVEELPSCCNDTWNSAVLVHGEFLYVGTSNSGVGRYGKKALYTEAPALIALEKRTGRMVARDGEKIGTRCLYGEWSSPALGVVDGKPLIIYGGGDGVCYAFEPVAEVDPESAALRKAWSFDCNPPEYRSRDGEPVPYHDPDTSRPLRERRSRKDDGVTRWPSEVIATPVFSGGRVYVAIGRDPLQGRGKGALNCIDAGQRGDISRSGKVWVYTDINRTMAGVAVADGLVYAVDIDGGIHCLDADSGKPYWVHQAKADIYAPALVADGRVYVGSAKGLVVLAAGKELQVLHRLDPVKMWTAPVAANGTLYLAARERLWAVAREGTPPACPSPASGPEGGRSGG